MAQASLARAVMKTVLGLLGVFGALLLLLALVRIPINLDDQKALFEKLAARAMDRPVAIDGSISVSTSLWPVFSMEDVRISNPAGFQPGDVLRMESVRLQVSVVQLLLRKIHVEDFSVQGLQITLLVDDAGAVNWTSDQGSTPVAVSRQPGVDDSGQAGLRPSSDTLVVERIQLNDISVSYRKPGMGAPFAFVLDHATGSARAGEPFALELQGSVREEPFEATLRAASLEELLTHDRSWMEIETRMAGASLKLVGNIDLADLQRRAGLTVSVDGEQLERFNRLLSLDLPPVPSYRAKGTLSAAKDQLTLKDLNLTVGSSEFNGEMMISTSDAKPRVDVLLTSPLFNLDDFDFEGWSPEAEATPASDKTSQSAAGTAEEGAPSASMPQGTAAKQVAKLLSPEVLARFNARLKIEALKVLSGKDELGNGELVLQQEGGRIAVEPLQLRIPGGSLLVTMSLKPGHDVSDAALRIKVENFDVGVLARRAKPETDLGGRINIDVDLKSSANHLRNILAQGNGYVDFSVHPENLRAGVLDLWAVNLITGIAERADEGHSKIECMIGRWGLRDGELTPDLVVLDTSRMRICMDGSVEFKDQLIDLTVRPTAKRPEFFSLATPLDVKGHFSDFELGIQAGGLVGTAVKFITSPVHVPVRRVFKNTLPTDGRDVCDMPLGAERPTERAPGCPRF